MKNPINIFCVCPLCRAEHIVEIKFDGYCRWQEGEPAQNAFPYLSAQEREYLISGLCEDCWPK